MKKNLMSVLILILLIVNIALSAVMMISVVGTNQKTAQLVDSVLLAMNLEMYSPGSGANVPLSDSVPYDFDGDNTLTILLAPSVTVNESGTVTSGKDVYIQFDIALLMNTKHEDYATYYENIASYKGLLLDTIESVVSAHTEEECRAGFTEDIREEILRAVQNLFKSQFVYQITLSNVKYG